MARMGRQPNYYQSAIPIKDAAVLSKLPRPGRARLVQRILDHDGF